MGAGDTASHLLEERLLDLHKLGGLNDIENLFHLPQEHHLGRGQGSSSHSLRTRLLAFWKPSPPHYCRGCENPSYLLLGAGFRPVFEKPPDNLEGGEEVRPEERGAHLPSKALTCSVKVASFSRNCTTQYASCGARVERSSQGQEGPGAKNQLPRTACQASICSLLPSHACSLSTHCCSGPTRHPALSARDSQSWCVRPALR